MNRKYLSSLLVSSALLLSTHTFAQSNASEASLFSGVGLSFVAGSVVVGTIQDLGKISNATVASVAAIGESTVLAIKDASGVVVGSIKVASSAVSAASIGMGSALRFVTESVGYAVYSGNQLIAFIPNEIGKSLIYYNSKVSQ